MADKEDSTPGTQPAAPQQPPAATPPTSPAADPKPPALLDKFSQLKEAARREKAAAEKAAAPPPSPAEPTKDPDMAAVNRLLAEDKRVKEEARKVAAERTAWEAQKAAEKAELEAARAMKAARTRGDIVGALKALGYSEDDLYTGDDSILFKLAEAKTPREALTEEQRAELQRAAIKAEVAAAKAAEDAQKAKEAEEAAQAADAEAKAFTKSAAEAYSASALAIIAANPAKYPTLTKWDIDIESVTQWAWDRIVESKGAVVPTEEEALAACEAQLLKWSREAAGITEEAPKPAPTPHRGISINPGWQSQTGSPERPRPVDLKGKFDALKERARKEQSAR